MRKHYYAKEFLWLAPRVTLLSSMWLHMCSYTAITCAVWSDVCIFCLHAICKSPKDRVLPTQMDGSIGAHRLWPWGQPKEHWLYFVKVHSEIELISHQCKKQVLEESCREKGQTVSHVTSAFSLARPNPRGGEPLLHDKMHVKERFLSRMKPELSQMAATGPFLKRKW